MYVSLTGQRTHGFRNWANNHPASNDDDKPGGATPIAVAELPSARDVPEEFPHRPWGIPGVGGAL